MAFYFAWMMCFTWTLIPIAVLGLLMYFFKPPGVTVDDNPLLPLYEVFMAFWAISFMVVSCTCYLYSVIRLYSSTGSLHARHIKIFFKEMMSHLTTLCMEL